MAPTASPAIQAPASQLSLGAALLETFQPEVRSHVLASASAAAEELTRWAMVYPSIRQERIVPLVLSVAAAAPFAAAQDVASTARLSLWVFALDDLFDEGDESESDLMRSARRYQETALGKSLVPSTDLLEAALREVRQDLARYPLFADLGAVWARALCGTVDGMIREYEWRQAYLGQVGTPLPGYAEYIEAGLYSIGAPPHMWAAVLTAGDQSAPNHLDYLGRMVRSASISIRLANDLRSYERERAEGNINSLMILGHIARTHCQDESEFHPWAVARVHQAIADHLAELAAMEQAPETATGWPEAAISGIAHFVCGFYRRYDYHTFSMEAN